MVHYSYMTKTLLLAEDEQGLREVLEDRFSEDGWKVVAVKDGEEAIIALRHQVFDLFILDLLMPNKDGFEVLTEMRSSPATQKTPVIVLSSLGTDDDIKHALKLGATDYFVKSQHPIGEVLEKAKAYITR